MPAPPEIQVIVNPEAFTRACEALGLKGSVDLSLRPSNSGGVRLGAARPGSILIYAGVKSQETNRLLFVTNQIIRTVLHELKHQQQFETWTPQQWTDNDRTPYRFQPAEIEANEFADRNVAKFRDLVRVKRTGASQLGRLGKAEARARA